MDHIFDLAENIRQTRKAPGLSQKELAKKLNLSDKTVSAYESSRAIPPVSTLRKIAEETHQPITVFFPENDEDKLDILNKKLNTLIEEVKKVKKFLKIEK